MVLWCNYIAYTYSTADKYVQIDIFLFYTFTFLGGMISIHNYCLRFQHYYCWPCYTVVAVPVIERPVYVLARVRVYVCCGRRRRRADAPRPKVKASRQTGRRRTRNPKIITNSAASTFLRCVLAFNLPYLWLFLYSACFLCIRCRGVECSCKLIWELYSRPAELYWKLKLLFFLICKWI